LLILATKWLERKGYLTILLASSMMLVLLTSVYALGMWVRIFPLLVGVRFLEGGAFSLLNAAILAVFLQQIKRLNPKNRKYRLAMRIGMATLIASAANWMGYWIGDLLSPVWWSVSAVIPFLTIAVLGIFYEKPQVASDPPVRAEKEFSAVRLFLLMFGINAVLAVFSEVVPDYLPLAAGEHAQFVATGSQLAFGLCFAAGGLLFSKLHQQWYTWLILGSLLGMMFAPQAIGMGLPLWWGVLPAFSLAGVGKGAMNTTLTDAFYVRYGDAYIAIKQMAFAVAMCATTFGGGALYSLVGINQMWFFLQAMILVVILLLAVPLPRWSRSEERFTFLSLLQEHLVADQGRVDLNWMVFIKWLTTRLRLALRRWFTHRDLYPPSTPFMQVLQLA
jgi:MFS family permease